MDVFDWRKRLLGLPYPDAEKSVGMFYRKMGLENCWEVVGPARAEFEQIAKEIKDFLEKNFEPTSIPVLWTMYMIGRSVTTARPTILFCSKEANCRKAVRKVIEKSGILKKFPSVRVGDADRPPDFDCLVPLALSSHRINCLHCNRQIGPFVSSKYSLKKKGTTIQCLLRTTSIGEPRQYIVISGKFANHSSFNTSLIINDEVCEVPINVGYILELFWSKASVLSIWIDQLCIDHHNIEERQDQLDLLPQIKNHATSILLPSEIHQGRGPDALVYREKANLSNCIFTCRYDQDCFTLWKATTGGILYLDNKSYLTTVSHGFTNDFETVRDVPVSTVQSGTSIKLATDNKHPEFEYNIQEWSASDIDEEQSINLTSGMRLNPESLNFDLNDEQSMDILGIPSLSTSYTPSFARFDLPKRPIKFGSYIAEEGSVINSGSYAGEKGSAINSGSYAGEKGSAINSENYKVEEGLPTEFLGEPTFHRDQLSLFPALPSYKITQHGMAKNISINKLVAGGKLNYEKLKSKLILQAVASDNPTKLDPHPQIEMDRRLRYLELHGLNGIHQDLPDSQDPGQIQLAPIGRVVKSETADHGLDYVLIELDNLTSDSVSPTSSRKGFEDMVLRSGKVSTAPTDTMVYAVTGSSGVITGHLSGTPIFMQLPRIKASQELWKVSLPVGLQPGDSGSIVVDADNGNILGHIVSGSPQQGAAYVIPIYQILNDIRERSNINPTFALLNPEQTTLWDEGELYSYDRYSGYTHTTVESSDKEHENT
ncbi:hypothetical protein EAE99_003097 [Botrytis elliptica]|nr:hypothetical protein EAE99_003097 [Botrytis elliptica]